MTNDKREHKPPKYITQMTEKKLLKEIRKHVPTSNLVIFFWTCSFFAGIFYFAGWFDVFSDEVLFQGTKDGDWYKEAFPSTASSFMMLIFMVASKLAYDHSGRSKQIDEVKKLIPKIKSGKTIPNPKDCHENERAAIKAYYKYYERQKTQRAKAKRQKEQAKLKAEAKAQQEQAQREAREQARLAEEAAQITVRYEIVPAEGSEWKPDTATHFIEALLAHMEGDGLSLCLSATHEKITCSVIVREQLTSMEIIAQIVKDFYPSAKVQEAPLSEEIGEFPAYQKYTVLKNTNQHPYEAITPNRHSRNQDPLAVITGTLTNLEPDEFIQFTIIGLEIEKATDEVIADQLLAPLNEVDPVRYRSYNMNPGFSDIAMIKFREWLTNRGRDQLVPRPDLSPSLFEQMFTKIQKRVMLNIMMVVMRSPHQERLTTLDSALSVLKNLSPNITDYTTKSATINTQEDHERHHPATYIDTLFTTPGIVTPMTPDELSIFWHLPHDQFEGDRLLWKPNIPDQVIATGDTDEILIGTATDGKTPTAITRPDRRYHAYITGQPGMGKSTLLHNLIHQDIQNGECVVVIDPHKILIDAILEHSIPDNRVDDVVYLDCADTAYPIPLNPFRTPEGDDPEATFQQILWTIKAIYADSWSETQMQTVYSTVLQTILTDPEATPLDIQEVINNTNYRRRIVSRAVKEDRLSQGRQNFWKGFEGQSHSRQQDRAASTFNRMEIFLGSTHLENMACHPDRLDFRKLIEEKKIILINLHGRNIKANAGGLGAILLSQFYLTSQDLGAINGSQPPRFYTYIDEAHQVVSNASPDMFTEGRKFGLSLTLANQYIGQLDSTTREAISGTVGTMVSFSCSHEETTATGKLYKPDIHPDQLITLSVGQAAIRTRIRGHVPPAFLCQTTQPINNTQLSPLSVDELKERSRQNLNLLTSKAVRKWIKERYDSDNFKKPPTEPDLDDFELDSDDG
jgi:hypothetical protein